MDENDQRSVIEYTARLASLVAPNALEMSEEGFVMVRLVSKETDSIPLFHTLVFCDPELTLEPCSYDR